MTNGWWLAPCRNAPWASVRMLSVLLATSPPEPPFLSWSCMCGQGAAPRHGPPASSKDHSGPSYAAEWRTWRCQSGNLERDKIPVGLASDLCPRRVVLLDETAKSPYSQQGLERRGFNPYHCHDPPVSPNNITSLGVSSFPMEWGISSSFSHPLLFSVYLHCKLFMQGLFPIGCAYSAWRSKWVFRTAIKWQIPIKILLIPQAASTRQQHMWSVLWEVLF